MQHGSEPRTQENGFTEMKKNKKTNNHPLFFFFFLNYYYEQFLRLGTVVSYDFEKDFEILCGI